MWSSQITIVLGFIDRGMFSLGSWVLWHHAAFWVSFYLSDGEGRALFSLTLLLFSKVLSQTRFSLLSPMLTQHDFRLLSSWRWSPHSRAYLSLSSLMYLAIPWADRNQQLNKLTGI